MPWKELIVVALCIGAVLVILKKNPGLRDRIIGAIGSASAEEKKNIVLVAGTLVVLNLLIWGMIPWFWSVLTYKWYVSIFFNLGLGAYLYLSKADSKMLASLVGGTLVAGLLTTAIIKIKADWKEEPKDSTGIRSVTRASNIVDSSHSVPMEIALRVIAECESGGKQFEPDGVTPLKNKGIPEKGIQPSGAFGKYQFLEMHREPAKKLALEFPNINYNLDTEEGQDNYARYRYSQTGTKDWEFYGGGKACWEPKLRAYTWGVGPGGEAVAITVVAPTNGWSAEIPTPYAPRRYELEGFGKKYRVLWNGSREEDFPQAERIEQKGIVYNFRLKSMEPEAVNIVVKFF